MSGKITGYDPKAQNFIDTDLFDVSKHVTQTSGVLEVGVSYTIITFVAGDNFTNVGGTNVTGNVFVATGTTPTTYTNGSTLAHYVTQSYTYAELKAGLVTGKTYKGLVNQSGTSAPTLVQLGNSLTTVPSFTRITDGVYESVETYDPVKTIVIVPYKYLSVLFLEAYVDGAEGGNTGKIFIKNTTNLGVLTDINGDYNIPLIIEVLP